MHKQRKIPFAEITVSIFETSKKLSQGRRGGKRKKKNEFGKVSVYYTYYA